MKRTFLLLCAAIAFLLLGACVRQDVQGHSPQANFETLWSIIDRQYCFLTYKHEQYGLDWAEVH